MEDSLTLRKAFVPFYRHLIEIFLARIASANRSQLWCLLVVQRLDINSADRNVDS